MEREREPLIRGDGYEWFVQLSDRFGAPLPLVNMDVVITAKPVDSDRLDDLDAIYKHTARFLANGAIDEGYGIRLGGVDPDPPYTSYNAPASGVLTEYLTLEDVVALAAIYDVTRGDDPKDIAVWDLQVTDATGMTKTLLRGTLRMRRDVGRLGIIVAPVEVVE